MVVSASTAIADGTAIDPKLTSSWPGSPLTPVPLESQRLPGTLCSVILIKPLGEGVSDLSRRATSASGIRSVPRVPTAVRRWGSRMATVLEMVTAHEVQVTVPVVSAPCLPSVKSCTLAFSH